MLGAIVCRRGLWMCCAALLLVGPVACRRGPSVDTPPVETIARTEFTDRIENFFEYEPLVPGKKSAFLIHLTDLSDGAPVEKAEVTLMVRGEPAGTATETKAKVGRVTGIYVAEVTVPAPGRYSVEFHVKTAALDERMVLQDFSTGGRP
ncbi:MAG TPA: FixH family protein [Methylomirabilota bacterium]|nr:FixH family protein [Methylomirabilota bacterium]